MENNKTICLTEGSIYQSLIKLALPIMASAFLSTAYSITDMAWIGMLGSKAVAGVGVGGMYVWLAQGLASLARMGGQVHVAQALGKGDKEEARQYGISAVQIVIIFGIVFGMISLIFTNPLVSFFGLTDVETIEYARVYLKLTCGLIVFSYLGYVLTGIYTAQGDSKTPLKANAVGLIINMILDPVLILGIGPIPKFGVAGAGIATVTAQIIVMILLIPGVLKIKGYENILQKINLFKIIEGKYYKKVIKIGLPTALQGSLYCAISMVLTKMVGTFGEGGIAVQRVGGQIESITWNTADGFAAAMNAFAAQNYGAGKIERVKSGYRLSAITMMLWGGIVALAFIFIPAQISEIFFHEADVIAISIGYLMILGIGEPFMCVELMAIGAISGMGNTKICSIISIVFTGLRIPLAWCLSHTGLGINGIWLALTITSIMKGVILHFAFYRQIKNIKKIKPI